MRTFLRARDLGIRFPYHAGKHEQRSQGGDRLGGVFVRQGRRQYIQALEGVSFDLAEGDRLAIVGHNGSGKSTLLRALGGIYPPFAGTVESNGRIASLFNISLGFRQEASGYRNIILKGLMSGRSMREIERVLPEIVEFSGLGGYIDMPLHTYSQGMAMRLAFSIATSFPNDILLMDEWIGAGDAAFREKVVERMNNYVEAAKIIVIASHSSVLLKRIANRAVWLESGKIRASGQVEEITDQYEKDVLSQSRPVHVPLDPGAIDFKLHRSGRGDGVITWDAVAAGVSTIDIILVSLSGEEKHFMRARSSGSHAIRSWIRPGISFRLEEPGSKRVLATLHVDDPGGPAEGPDQ